MSEMKHQDNVLSIGYNKCFGRASFVLQAGRTAVSEMRELSYSEPSLPHAAADIRFIVREAGDASLAL